MDESLQNLSRVDMNRIMVGTAYHADFIALKSKLEQESKDTSTATKHAFWNIVGQHEEYYHPLINADRIGNKRSEALSLIEKPTLKSVPKPSRKFEDETFDYSIPAGEYNNAPVPIHAQLEWVAANLDNPLVTHKDAPNTAAWSMLMHYRPNQSRREDFWNKMFPKVLTNRQAIAEMEQEEAEELADDPSMKSCEDFLMRTAAEV